MNYRHSYHAGNHADVFKHVLLSRLILLLSRKETPFTYLDAHAGAGLYDLYTDQATATQEWKQGIARVAGIREQMLADYLGVVEQMNEKGLRYYPGSPELARRLMRNQDRLILNEKHPEDGQLLKVNMQADSRVAVHQGDAWLLPRAFLPTREKRALLLLDPPFEQFSDWDACVSVLAEINRRMRQCVTAIWYPIKDRRQLGKFRQGLKKSGVPKLLNAELMVNPPDNAMGLNGSGMAVVNPPWGLESELKTLLPLLAAALGQGQPSWNLEWLVEEK